MSQVGTWSSLPDDVVGVLLCTLSLIELARVSSTCRCFYAHYRRRMVAQQTSRSDLAVNVFGEERIKCIADAIGHLLKLGESESARYNGFTGRAFATYYLPSRFTNEPPHICLNVHGHRDKRSVYDTGFVTARNMSPLTVYLRVDGKGVDIMVSPTCDEDLEGVALVQALLHQGTARAIQDSGQYARITLSQYLQPSRFTQAGLDAQFGPLMPFALRSMPTERVEGDCHVFCPNIQIAEAKPKGRKLLASVRKACRSAVLGAQILFFYVRCMMGC
jgi:hypothetical protein